MKHFFPYTGLAFLLILGASWALTGIVTAILKRRAILDQPNDRSSHTVPTPRGGGWGLMLALLPAWVWATARAGRLDTVPEALLILGVVALMAVSWIDDRRGLAARTRFAVQIVVIAGVMMALPDNLSLTRGLLPATLDRLVAGIIWLWFVNLFNFMDGIDGITGGSAAAMGLGVMLISLQQGPLELDAFRGAMIVAASCGFLIWNWHPAKVFLGDVGSVPLGYLLGYELIRLAMDGGQIPALIIPLYYLADATITLIRRLVRGERIWEAHREHFYQRAVQYGRSHARVARMAVVLQLLTVILALLAARYGLWPLAGAVVLVGLVLRWMSWEPAHS